ncbi:50S ribosomal protein L9 [Wolbachia endosymbiont of Howardula sp.]|uniref:50S ribosomal protein L9 n=1 Tax=Wolbachia endosymbiont of Howardula sp. TaxID=2916816 RepID=UPI00217E1533|nr:50S ribosomal protein L9 [Wolbachia endosymbiont of Howardula sp.]UWI83119.1 50S ribosomal protein L9 [Wolbachia endosymbiont of Howardula sp.]
MLIILKENITKLGIIGQIIKVKPGYARNYLFPKKKAVRASHDNITKLERQITLLETENIQKINLAKELANSFINQSIILVRHASEDGKIFGTITKRDIVKSLSHICQLDSQNILLNKIKIKSIGQYTVNITLHSEVIVPMTVHIVRSEKEKENIIQNELSNQLDSKIKK